MADTQVRIAIVADNKAAAGVDAGVRQVERLGQAAQQANAGAERLADALRRVGHYGAGLAGVSGFGTLAADAIKAADAYTNIASRLKIVSASALDLSRNMAATFDIAQRTRQSWEGVADLYGRMARVTAELGLSQRQLAGIVETVNQAIAVSGGSAASAQAALVQFGQALASGVLRGEELNSILEQAPRLAQALADGLGVGIGQLRKLGEEGALTGEKVVAALQKSAAAVAGDFAAIAPTVSGAWQQIGNAAQKYVGEVDKAAGATSAISGAMSAVANNFGTFATAIEAAGVALGTLAAGRIAATILAKRQLAAETLKAALAEQQAAAAAMRSAEANVMLAGSTTALTAAKQRLAAANAAVAASMPVSAVAALGGPIGAAITGFTALAGVLAVVSANAEQAGTAMQRSIADETRDLVESLQKQIDKIKERNRLLNAGTPVDDRVAERAAEIRADNARLQGEIAALSSSISPYANAPKIAALKRQIAENESALEALIAKQRELNAAQDKYGDVNAAKRVSDYFDKFGSKAEQAAAKVRELDAATQKAMLDAQKLPEAQRAGEMQRIAASHQAKLDELRKVGSGGTAAIKAEREVIDATVEAYKDYAKAIEGLNDIKVRATAATQEMTAAEAVRERLIQSGAWGRLSQEARDVVDAYVDTARAAEMAADAEKAMHEARKQTIAAAQREAQSLEEQVERAREETAAIGLTAEQLDALKLARLDAAIAAKEQALATLEAGDAAAAEVQAVLHQIDALRELRGLAADSAVKRDNVRAIEEQKRAWDKFADDIERSLTDSLYRSFEAGKDFGETFVDSLRNTLKAAALKLAVQVVVDPVMGQVRGALGLGGGSSSSSGSILDIGSSLYSGFTGGFATSAGKAMATFGNQMGFEGLRAFGADMMAGEGIAGFIGNAAPYVAAAMAIASLLGKKSTPHVGGLAFGSESGFTSPDDANSVHFGTLYNTKDHSATPLGTSNFTESDWFKRENKQVSDELGRLSMSLAAQVNAITRSYGAGSGYSVGLAYSADDDDPSRGRFGIVKDGRIVAGSRQRYAKEMQEGMQQFFADIPSEILEGLRGIDLSPVVDAWLDKSLTASGDLLEGMADQQANAILGALQSGFLDEFLAQMDTVAMSFNDITAAVVKFAQVANLKPIFDALSLDIYKLGNALVDAFGGVERAGSAMSAYYESFFSEEERTANTARELARQFDRLGLAMPATKVEFRDLVESLDLTTEAGRTTYAALINLSPAFAQVADAAERATKDAIDAANEAARRAADDLKRRLLDGVDSAFGVLERSIDAARAPLEESIDRYQVLADRAANITKTLVDAIARLRAVDVSQMSVAAARRVVDAMVVQARSGAMLDEGMLSRITGTLTADTPDNYATRADFLRSQALSAAKLDELKAVIGTQEDAAQRQIELARQQLAVLDKHLVEARAQVDALNGIDTSVKSVADALTAFAAALAAARTGMPATTPVVSAPVVGGGVATTPPAASSYRPDLDAIQAAAGGTGAYLLAGYQPGTFGHFGWREYANGVRIWEWIEDELPKFAAGTNYLPRDMVAKVHEGERIIPAADNRELMRRLSRQESVIDIAPLLDRLERLEQTVRAGQGAIASNTRQSKDLLDSVINGANTVRMEAVA